ncbi:ABC transporter substrate-binding protein [Vibrio sp. CK2-1]|uniref:ABC transporter substrate-binding protein n=1 Tax=Vibrio sp. CK2-1 TaxID=2912249 RepID=UPI001F36260B|nr:ABC transporter substrate-binding protein [Vibrio sp. CK2-1]MCF7353270.1 ABC transporter substrate-binding protein [Vibrio sp. CK2-1]
MKSWLVSFLLLWTSFSSHAESFKHEMGEVSLDSVPQKVVALDWVLTEHLLALGVTPAGIADVKGYQAWVVSPQLPESVVNVGSRREPNLELLAQMKPDLILMSDAMSPAYQKLNAIAPTMVLSIYTDSHQPIENAKSQVRNLGKVLHRSEQAEQVIADFDEKIQANKLNIEQFEKTSQTTIPPLLLIRFIGEKHIRIHGNSSLSGETAQLMGLTNAWQQQGNNWGFSSATVQQLAPLQGSEVFYYGPLTDDERKLLNSNPIWKVMKFVREQRAHELPPVWTFGGLLAAQKFSDEVTRIVTKTKTIESQVKAK